VIGFLREASFIISFEKQNMNCSFFSVYLSYSGIYRTFIRVVPFLGTNSEVWSNETACLRVPTEQFRLPRTVREMMS
jgi:hypothetical protein